ncbi:unnamed protein product, partial [Ectocarpus sp. 12 AP-2014]
GISGERGRHVSESGGTPFTSYSKTLKPVTKHHRHVNDTVPEEPAQSRFGLASMTPGTREIAPEGLAESFNRKRKRHCSTSTWGMRNIAFLRTRLAHALVRDKRPDPKDHLTNLNSHVYMSLKPHCLPVPGQPRSTTLVQKAWPARIRVQLLRAPPAPVTNLRPMLSLVQSVGHDMYV